MEHHTARNNGINYVATVTLVVLVIFSVLFGAVIEKGSAFSQFRAISPSWPLAQWLEYPDGSEVIYLRKNFNLTSIPDWSGLTVSAVDDFIVYINGIPVGKKNLAGRNPTEIYDVTALMKLGKNLLAIRSASGQRDLQARIIARLNWKMLGENHLLVSNRDWRVENKELFQRQGSLAWYQTDFEDSDWIHAEPIIDPSHDQTGILKISEYALQKLQVRHWVGITDLQTRHINLSRTFTVDAANISGAWLGVSIDGKFQLSINKLIFPELTGEQDKMKYFSIAAYLKERENQVSILILSAGNRLAKVAISGFIKTENEEIEFSADQNWHCRPTPCHLLLLEPWHGQKPLLIAHRLVEPMAFTTQQWYRRIKLLLLTLISSLFPAALFIPLSINRCRFGVVRSCWVYGQPYALTALLLAVLLIIDADPRFNFSSYFSIYIPLLVIALILILLFMPLIEASRRSKPHKQ